MMHTLLWTVLLGCNAGDEPNPKPAQEKSKVSEQGAREVQEPFVKCQLGTCRMRFAEAPEEQPRNLALHRCSNPTAACEQQNTGRLTVEGRERVQALAAKVGAAALLPAYGCPGCADGPTYVAEFLPRTGAPRESTFDPIKREELPPALRELSELFEQLEGAVMKCQPSSLVEIEGDCKPRE